MSKTFSAEQIRLNLVDLMAAAADPSAGGGVAASIGSQYLRTDGTSWWKTSAPDTGWTQMVQSFAWYSVRDYGATGDGVTDDRAAIAACIAACIAGGGGRVYFPQGTYAVSKDGANPYSFELATQSDVMFSGSGPSSIILQSGSGAGNPWSIFSIAGGCSRIVFEDLVFDGSGLTNPDAGRENHLVLVGGSGAGAIEDVQFIRCQFRAGVAGSGDGVRVDGATVAVSRFWFSDCFFDALDRYGVSATDGCGFGWVHACYLQDCEAEIFIESTAAAGISSLVIAGNMIIHSDASEHRAVVLQGDASSAGLISRMVFSQNVILDGFVEIGAVNWSSVMGNAQTSGAYAGVTDAAFAISQATQSTFTGNAVIRASGSGVGECMSVLDDVSESSLVRLSNNVLLNEVTNAGIILAQNSFDISIGDNLCRSLDAGTAVAAIDIQATTIDVDNVLVSGNQITAAAGSFDAGIRLLANGANIVNCCLTANQGDQIDYGAQFEDAGAGTFTGRIMWAGNNFDGGTGDYNNVGVTVVPHIGWNAGPFGSNLFSGAGAPSVSAPVGSMYLRSDGGQATAVYYKESGTGGSGWVGIGGGVIVFGVGDAGTVATALYMAPGYIAAADATEFQIAVTRPGTIRNLYIQVAGAGTDATTVTFTVRKNGADQALVATIGNTSTGSASDLVNSFTVVAGDTVSIQITKGGAVTAGQTGVFASVELI